MRIERGEEMEIKKTPVEKGQVKDVVRCGVMPDGTKIQIEDWSRCYKLFAPCSTVAAFPKSKVNIMSIGEPKAGETFRASFTFFDAKSAEEAFERLCKGEAQLKEYEIYMDNPRHAICL